MVKKVVNLQLKTDHAAHPKKAAKSSQVVMAVIVVTTMEVTSSNHTEEAIAVVKIEEEMETIDIHITETTCVMMAEMIAEVGMEVEVRDLSIKTELETHLDTKEVAGLETIAKADTTVEAVMITINSQVEVATTEVASTTKIGSTRTEMVILEVIVLATTITGQEIVEVAVAAVTDKATVVEVVLLKVIVTSERSSLYKFISNTLH